MKFYTIDNDYVKKLYQIDHEVFYERLNYENKPYVGIVIQNNNFNYFLPLTSAKPKHKNWNNVSKTNYIIYEMLPANFSPISEKWVYTANQNNIKHILSVLEIKKMIPVPKNYYTEMNFSQIPDINYRALVQKEYNFLKPLQNEIFHKAIKLYNAQKSSGIIIPFACNYSKLEKVCKEVSNKVLSIV